MVQWLTPSDVPVRGLDHLGMRVASEAYYAALLDFTTTVTYRPRYLSFFAWAWTRFLRDRGPTYEPAELTVWMKSQEWWLLLASMLVDPDASRLGGIARAREVLEDEDRAEDPVKLRLDFLKATEGTLSVYRGVMQKVGLLGFDEEGNEVPTAAAEAVAADFERALRQSGFEPHLSATVQARERLREYGKWCGLTRLQTPAGAAERGRLIELMTSDRADGALVSPRKSLAFILRLAEVIGWEDIAAYRTAFYTSADLESGRSVQLPAVYDDVADRWTLYQLRDYVLLGLEALLSAVVRIVDRSPWTTLTRALDEIDAGLSQTNSAPEALFDGSNSAPEALFDVSLATAGDALDRLASALWPHGPTYVPFSRGPRFPSTPHDGAEAALAEEIRRGGYGPDRLCRAGIDLVLAAWARWRGLRDAPGSPGFEWPFPVHPRRVPLTRLDELLEQVRGRSPRELVRRLVQELVIEQHIETAFRKLLEQPRNDSARLRLSEGRLSATPQPFQAQPTSPRIVNVLEFVHDLALVDDASGHARLTDAGRALCARVEAGP